MVVMYDAAGVRWAVSRQASILNRIVRELRLRRPRGEVERESLDEKKVESAGWIGGLSRVDTGEPEPDACPAGNPGFMGG